MANETVRRGERRHEKTPGRTRKSRQRDAAPARKLKVDDEEVKTPKLDLSFSIKLAQSNTGAYVDGAFIADNRATGGYGTTTLPEEEELMRTPALPGGDEDAAMDVSNIKISNVGDFVLRKMAAQAPLPTPEDTTPGRTQPAGKPKDTTLGKSLGVLGGAAGGAGLGASIAQGTNLSGGAALVPVVGGAVGGGLLGGVAGNKIEETLRESEVETAPEDELQEMLRIMKQQNPEFYQQQQPQPQQALSTPQKSPRMSKEEYLQYLPVEGGQQ